MKASNQVQVKVYNTVSSWLINKNKFTNKGIQSKSTMVENISIVKDLKYFYCLTYKVHIKEATNALLKTLLINYTAPFIMNH